MDLCGVLKQTRNQAVAPEETGHLASQQGQNEQSIEYFQQASSVPEHKVTWIIFWI